MKKKMSWNATRKIAYAAKADKSSRNQDTIGSTPIVGRWETVWFDEEERPLEKPYKKIVHDPTHAQPSQDDSSTRVKKRASNARKERRQKFAWGNCRLVRTGAVGQHVFQNSGGGGMHCQSCGAPIG